MGEEVVESGGAAWRCGRGSVESDHLHPPAKHRAKLGNGTSHCIIDRHLESDGLHDESPSGTITPHSFLMETLLASYSTLSLCKLAGKTASWPEKRTS
jgi:hypothetical protein